MTAPTLRCAACTTPTRSSTGPCRVCGAVPTPSRGLRSRAATPVGAARTTTRPVRTDGVTGSITGQVHSGVQTAPGAGQLVIAAVGSLAVAAVGLVVLVWVALAAVHSAVRLLPVLLIGLVLWWILRRGRTPRLGVGWVATRWMGGAARGMGRVAAVPIRRSGGTATAEVHRFRVVGDDRALVDCELVGELFGAALRTGDRVRVEGRRSRLGTLRARRVVLLNSGAVCMPRTTLAFTWARTANVLAVPLVVAVLAVVLFAVTR